MKRAFSFCALLFAFLLVLSSCSFGKKAGTVLSVNGNTVIDSEVFSYFLNEVTYSRDDISPALKIAEATNECLRYLAVNTEFAKLGMKLSANDRADCSLETNNLWGMYGDYLSGIGVSKDSFFKIKQYEYAARALRLGIYGSGGEYEIPESSLKTYFVQNYVGIKYFYEELYTVIPEDRLASMSAEQQSAYASAKSAAAERYRYISSLATYVNNAIYSIDEAYMAVTGNIERGVSVNTTVLGRNDTLFPAEFINAVFNQREGNAFLITDDAGSYVYFVQRVGLMENGDEFFEKYRADCLNSISEQYFSDIVNNWTSQFSVIRHTGEVDRCVRTVEKVDRAKYMGTGSYEMIGLSKGKR